MFFTSFNLHAAKWDQKKSKKEVEADSEAILLSDDSTSSKANPSEKPSKSSKAKPSEKPSKKSSSSSSSTPTPSKRTSTRKRTRRNRLVEDDDDLTPEKIPREALTPRKSRRSKDMSPPPLRYRQNRMPEQIVLVTDESKCFTMFFP